MEGLRIVTNEDSVDTFVDVYVETWVDNEGNVCIMTSGGNGCEVVELTKDQAIQLANWILENVK